MKRKRVDVQKMNHIYTEDSKGNFYSNVLFADLDYEIIEQIQRRKIFICKLNHLQRERKMLRIIFKIIDESLDSIRKQIEKWTFLISSQSQPQQKVKISISIIGASQIQKKQTSKRIYQLIFSIIIQCSFPKSDDFSSHLFTNSPFLLQLRRKTSFSLLRKKVKFSNNSKMCQKVFTVAIIYPSQNQSNNIFEIYNTVLSTTMTLENFDSVTLFDNESMYNVLDYYLELDFIDYEQLNNLVYEDLMESVTHEFSKFLILSQNTSYNSILWAFIFNFIDSNFFIYFILQNGSTKLTQLKQIIKQVINRSFKLYQCESDPINIFSTLINRQKTINEFYGQYCNPLQDTLIYYQNQTSVYQCFAQNYQIIPEIKEITQTNTFLAIDAAIGKRFKALGTKFDNIYIRSGFVHWYVGEGGDFDQMVDNREYITYLQEQYEYFHVPEESHYLDDNDED